MKLSTARTWLFVLIFALFVLFIATTHYFGVYSPGACRQRLIDVSVDGESRRTIEKRTLCQMELTGIDVDGKSRISFEQQIPFQKKVEYNSSPNRNNNENVHRKASSQQGVLQDQSTDKGLATGLVGSAGVSQDVGSVPPNTRQPLSIGIMQSERQHRIVAVRQSVIQTAASSSHRRPLDMHFINESFEQLKRIVRTTLSKHSHRTNELMKHRVPEMNSSSWRLHSPSGRNFSHEELRMSGYDGLLVPNVAHFILPFGNVELQFHHLVCILSCAWIMKPRLLYLWYVRQPPVGPNWELLQRNLSDSGFWESHVVLARRQVPRDVYEMPLGNREHQSDVMRLEAVLSFGGAYFDLDVITLRPLEPLRLFNFTIGRQSSDGLCNGVFLAVPNSTFLAMWHLAYQTFDTSRWSPHSVNLPHHLCSAAAFKHLCHVEQESMDRPTWDKYERDWIYERPRKWDWKSKNYVMHLWYRFHNQQYNMTSIRKVDSMLGDMFRYVLLGNASL